MMTTNPDTQQVVAAASKLLEGIVAEFAKAVAAHIAPRTERRLYDRTALAKYLGVSPTHVDNLRARGVLPPVVPGISSGKKRPTPVWDIRDVDARIDEIKGAM